MILTKIKTGTYKGHYEDEIGVIYTEEIAQMKFPENFKPTKSKKKRAKSWLS